MANDRYTILDGGMGRELERRGAPFRQPEWSALSLYEAPDLVRETHEDFIKSGAEIIITNSYAIVPFHLGKDRFEKDGEKLAALSGKLAKEAVEKTGHQAKIAGSLPPLFGSYRPDDYNQEAVAQIVTPLLKGLAPFVDIWLCETQSMIAEPLAVKEMISDDKPFWVSFTLSDEESLSPQLRSGESVADAVAKMIDAGVTTILYNCSHPEVIEQALKVTREIADRRGVRIQTGAYANAFIEDSGLLDASTSLNPIRKDMTPDDYVKWAQKWTNQGASIIGGCCGIGPDYIASLRSAFK